MNLDKIKIKVSYSQDHLYSEVALSTGLTVRIRNAVSHFVMKAVDHSLSTSVRNIN